MGTVLVTNSTFTANSAASGAGGAIVNYNPNDSFVNRLAVVDSTLTDNTAGVGGGIATENDLTLTLQNTIVAGNAAMSNPDILGPITTDHGYNPLGTALQGTTHGSGDVFNDNPLLAALGDYGGPTPTMALLPGSPALNAGDPSQAGTTDQRGVLRGGGINIGAYQASASAFVLSAPAKVTAGGAFDVTVAAVDPFGQVAVGYTGTVIFSTTDPDPGVVLPADYTFTTADGGVHTFSDTGLGEATLRTRGYQSLAVTDTADEAIAGNATVKVRHSRHHAGSPGVSLDPAAADQAFTALASSGEGRRRS